MPDEVFDILGRVAVDTSAFREIPQKAKQTNAELARTPAKVSMDVDTGRAQAKARAMRAALEDMDRTVIKPRIDTRAAEASLTKLEAKMGGMLQGAHAGRPPGLEGLMTGKVMGLAGVAGAVGGMAMYAAPMVAGAFGSTAGGAAQIQKMEKFMSRAYGSTGDQFVASAQELQKQTGFLAEDFMRAALIGKTLVANYGLQTNQIEKLIGVSADLAATSPYEDIQNVSNAMERVQSAIRGEAKASERLGLTLNDTYMKNIAFGGSLKGTWEKMSDLEKYQYRYQEILNQTKDVLGAASDDEGLSKSLREAKARFSEAGIALGEKLLPALTKLVDLAAKIPTGVYEAGGWATVAGAGALGSWGAYKLGEKAVGGVKGLLGRGAVQAVEEAASEAAGKAAVAATKAATTTATKAATTVAGEAAGTALGQVSGKLISQSAASAIASVGGLAAIAAAAALVAVAIKNIAADTDAAYADAADRDEQRNLLQRYTQQRQYGIDWGVYRDESGKYVQGASQGWDVASGTGFRTQTVMVDGRPHSGMIVGSEYTANKYGAALGSPYYGQYASQPQQVGVKVTLDNQGSTPLQVKDAKSYAPSNY